MLEIRTTKMPQCISQLLTWHFCLKSTGPSESVVLVI